MGAEFRGKKCFCNCFATAGPEPSFYQCVHKINNFFFPFHYFIFTEQIFISEATIYFDNEGFSSKKIM